MIESINICLRKKKVVERDELGNCKKCLKSFTSLPTLKKHQRTCTKRLQCDDCDEVCPDPEALRKHKKSHVYKCEFCFKECINKNQLNTHRTRVHAEKVYKCQLCDSSFPTANWLKAHAKVHNKVVLTYKVTRIYFYTLLHISSFWILILFLTSVYEALISSQ